MNETVAVSLSLDADPRNVGEARRALRDVLARSGAEHLTDPATVAVSELVTNAFVHAASAVVLNLWSTGRGVRVEVEDRGAHLPTRRQYADTSGTGRGLQLLEELTDRWGTSPRARGKTVWFEIGDVDDGSPSRRADSSDVEPRGGADHPDEADDLRPVTLRRVPLLMHVAWQEHAATLLREYLLHVLDTDDEILDKHARASEAMSVLDDQLPGPEVGDEPDALMADAVEPNVTADEVVLRVPASAVGHFTTLDELLRSAIAEARAGRFLSPPTQPEIDEMRSWLCSEVVRQGRGATTATPWVARTDVRATLADQEVLRRTYAHLAAVDSPLLATDEASIIVAVSPAAADLLGYEVDELLGRRVIVVVPERFHQAHIAGTTLNATNGRDILLGVPLAVPMVRADGREVLVQIEVRAQRFDETRRVFVARFRPA